MVWSAISFQPQILIAYKLTKAITLEIAAQSSVRLKIIPAEASCPMHGSDDGRGGLLARAQRISGDPREISAEHRRGLHVLQVEEVSIL